MKWIELRAAIILRAKIYLVNHTDQSQESGSEPRILSARLRYLTLEEQHLESKGDCENGKQCNFQIILI